VQGLEGEAERLRLEESAKTKEAEEYQTHLEEELAESQVLSLTKLALKLQGNPHCLLT